MAEAREISNTLARDVAAAEDREERGKYSSERGPFAIFANPTMNKVVPPEQMNGKEMIEEFDLTELASRYGEEPAREKVAEMLDSYGGGVSMNVLFAQDSKNGMNLTHTWFGPNLELFRHGHPRYGDCLYYVLAGELILGRRRLGPGSGFFLPWGHPYKYTAGPEGVEILEFRADGLGDPKEADTKVEERSLEDVQRIIDSSNANRRLWKQPAGFGDTGHAKADD